MEAYWVQFIVIAVTIVFMNGIAGIGVCVVLKKNMSPAICELAGAALMGTFCEFTIVPLVLLKAPFNVAVMFIIVGYLIFDVLGLVALFRTLYRKPRIRKREPRGSMIMGILLYSVVIGITIFVMYESLVLQHMDEDDSRFVVNAMDMVKSNTLFLVNPATGRSIDTWYGELLKDVVSPLSVFPAAIAYITGMKAVIVYHSVIPLIVLVLISCLYYELADRFFPGRRDYKSLFVVFLWIVNIFGYYSVYGQETFMMTRLWQGKSIVAGIGIPAVIMLLMDVYNDSDNIMTYVFLFMLNASMCFCSGMGIILMALMIACYGLIYTISRKNPNILLFLGLSCIPNVLCYVVHLGLKYWIIR